MRSAAVTALGRLVFEFSSKDPNFHSMLPSMLQTVLILADDPCREVTKSMVAFVRVTVAAASTEQLEPLLPDIMNGLLKYHRGKDRFRAKIKIIIKKLVKMFGYDTLMPFVPESDTRLLTHMRKLTEREARRRNSHAYQSKEEAVSYDAMMESDGEEDSDDGMTLVTGMTRKSRLSRVTGRSGKQTLKRKHTDSQTLSKATRTARQQGSVRIKNDADGEILDVKELKTVRFTEPGSDNADSDAEMEFDASGKLVVHDVNDSLSMSKYQDDGDTLLTFKSKRSMQSSRSRDSKSGQGKKDNPNRKNSKPLAKPGQAYKAKKAGGDTKKKGQKYEPYAYVQLDGRNFSKKNRRQAVEQMGLVVQRGNKRQRR
jgi:ribosomal RNA-processing protein 12